jgi:hypothetical protein
MVVLAYIFLCLVVLLCVALVGTVVMHLLTGVPYVPTPRRVAEAMIRLSELKDGERVADLGAGDARVLIAAKRMFPGITAEGCELVPTIWLIGILNIALSRWKVRLSLSDVKTFDVRDADVVLLYLMPEMLAKLEPKFDRELKPGTRVVSRSFRFPTRQIAAEREMEGFGGKSKLYLYRW